jgi:hypothetical protein
LRWQVNTVRASGERNVYSRIDEKLRGRDCVGRRAAANGFGCSCGQFFKFTSREIFLSQLHNVYACGCSFRDFPEQLLLTLRFVTRECFAVGNVAQPWLFPG